MKKCQLKKQFNCVTHFTLLLWLEEVVPLKIVPSELKLINSKSFPLEVVPSELTPLKLINSESLPLEVAPLEAVMLEVAPSKKYCQNSKIVP